VSRAVKLPACLAAACLALVAGPSLAQDEYIVVTGMRTSSRAGTPPVPPPPVVGLRRQADSAVRDVEIVSDSRTEDLRRSEVQAMLLAAIDLARREGVTLVTGEFELVELNRENWQDQFPGLAQQDAAKQDDEDDDDSDYGDEDDNAPPPAFKDDGSTMVIHLKVKTRLDGSVDNAEKKIAAFVKKVPVTGRSEMKQRGGLALTIVNPEQYRGEIYGRIAGAAKTAAGFYGPDYGLEVTGLDHAIEWKQVSNTEVFLFIRYDFAVRK
jgi:hypothetical protein